MECFLAESLLRLVVLFKGLNVFLRWPTSGLQWEFILQMWLFANGFLAFMKITNSLSQLRDNPKNNDFLL